MKTLLTVDWDFFVEEKFEWDMGHRENLLFLKMLWSTRGNLIDVMRATGEEVGFWQRVKRGARFDAPLWVSDSHAYAYKLLAGVSRVVLVDAHHDCWMGNKGAVSCDNWLRVWLRGSPKRRATWVRPGWMGNACELPEDMAGRVEVVDWKEGLDLGLEGRVRPHVCRSGCWVPPWLDRAFLGFLEGFGGGLDGVCSLQEGDWDPLQERWQGNEMEEARKESERVRKAMEEMNGKARAVA